MVHTTPVTKSQNTTQDGRLRCIIVSSVNQTKQPQLRYEDPWPIMLYGPWLCVLFQHDAPKSSIVGSFLASSFQHYLCDWRLFCSVTPSYTTWRKVELPFQTMWVWRFLHPTNFPPLFLTGGLENCVLEIFEQGRTLIQNGRDRKTGMLVGLRGRVKSAHLVLTKVQRGKLNIFTNVLYEMWVIIQGRIQEFLIGGPNCGKSEEQLPKKTVGQLCYHLMWKISANCRQTVSRQLAACW